MKQRKSFKFVIFIMMLLVLAGTGIVYAALFQPIPYEDGVRGRNSYAYNPAIRHPTYNEQINFINSIKVETIMQVRSGRSWINGIYINMTGNLLKMIPNPDIADSDESIFWQTTPVKNPVRQCHNFPKS